MRKVITNEELMTYMQDLITCQALELIRCQNGSGQDLYIPYMMNDAVEYYLILENCGITGDAKAPFDEGTQMELQPATEDGKAGRHALTLQRSDGSLATLWYESACSQYRLYQYHRIGHFWVKGAEKWRQLVYAIGTANDKRTFLGEEACNEKELQLLQLMHFAPFRYWSPIDESLDEYYAEEEEGRRAMEYYAAMAKDREYQKLLRHYRHMRKLPDVLFAEKKKENVRRLAEALLLPQRQKLFRLLQQELREASEAYEERDYGERQNEAIRSKREAVTRKLLAEGYRGIYPDFCKEENGSLTTITAMEEHPFTIAELEYEDFGFRIRLLKEEEYERIQILGPSEPCS